MISAQLCVICGEPIHAERLAALPLTKTCSREHSEALQAKLRRESAVRAVKRSRQRAREAKAEGRAR